MVRTVFATVHFYDPGSPLLWAVVASAPHLLEVHHRGPRGPRLPSLVEPQIVALSNLDAVVCQQQLNIFQRPASVELARLRERDPGWGRPPSSGMDQLRSAYCDELAFWSLTCRSFTTCFTLGTLM